MHHKARAHVPGPEQQGREDGVVHHKQHTTFAAQGTNGFQVGDLGAGVGHGFDKHHTGVGAQRGSHVGNCGGVHLAHFHTKVTQRAKQAVGVAKHKSAGDDVVTRTQQREKQRADSAHAGGKTHRAHALLHTGQFGFQRCGGGCALAGVVVAAFQRALEHTNQVFHLVKTVLHRGVDGFVYTTMLHTKFAVAMYDLGGESFVTTVHDFSRCQK